MRGRRRWELSTETMTRIVRISEKSGKCVNDRDGANILVVRCGERTSGGIAHLAHCAVTNPRSSSDSDSCCVSRIGRQPHYLPYTLSNASFSFERRADHRAVSEVKARGYKIGEHTLRSFETPKDDMQICESKQPSTAKEDGIGVKCPDWRRNNTEANEKEPKSCEGRAGGGMDPAARLSIGHMIHTLASKERNKKAEESLRVE